MAEPEPDVPPAVVALQHMLLLMIGSLRAAVDAAEQAVRDPETMRAATQVLGGLAGLAAPLLAEFATFAQSAAAPATAGPPAAATASPADADADGPSASPAGHRAA